MPALAPTRVDVPPHVARLVSPGARAYTAANGRLSILLSRDEIAPGDTRWHLSIAGQDNQVPAWNELVELAHKLRPGVVWVVGIPPREWWLNVHEGCLHLWQLDDPALEDQWRSERQGHTPT